MRSRQRFEIAWESRLGAWMDDLAAIVARTPRVPVAWSGSSWTGGRSFKRIGGFATSLFAHAAALVLLAQFSAASHVQPAAAIERPDSTPIYIDMRALEELKILQAVPIVRASGPGGVPGASPRLPLTPAPVPVPEASTVIHPSLTIIVNPPKPENNRQAIHQALAPPDLKIKLEQQVPDIIQLDDPAAPKPQVNMTIRRPVAPESPASAQATPAPSIDAEAPELVMKITSSVPQPKMPVAYFASGSMQAPRERASSSGSQETAATPLADAAGNIVAMSVDPATFSQLTTLADGNRYAALAIAPTKEGAGSPGGKPNSAPAPGSAGTGAGGDASATVGAGKSGGGGGASQAAEFARLSAVGGGGTSGGVDANRLLSPVLPATIFPVSIAPKPRHAPMVISAGPMGGGGLDIYGALNCGKVYSIFLPMPGKNWVLQYCAHEPAPPTRTEPPGTASVIRMQPGLVPPSPQEQFDFRRLPVPDKDSDKLIIVQATIDKTGSVSNARLFQGVLLPMDEAAVQALGKWKFAPATRAGSPVDVDALVGIPARLPPETNAASPSALKTQKN